ncbi:MAG: hypothetical protein ACI841_001388 [Planctomycetota bacterium]|jgi:hypothetical protein
MGDHTTEAGDFKRGRKPKEHINNCTDGYTVKGYNQVHHILCISCLSNGKITSGDLGFIKKCFAATTWNINDGHNCIGLPKKTAYKDKPSDKGWDKLPCHQVDHNPHYTGEVTKWLNTNLWAELDEPAGDCTKKGNDIASALKSGTDHWKKFLTDRGKKHKGTAYCWEHRNDDGMEDKWYVPFSMHPGNIPKRKPIPKPNPALSEILKLL